MMQKPGDRQLSNRDLLLCQSVLEFGQRDVRLLRYQLPHQILVRRQREILVAAELGRADAARFPVKLEEADHRADADAALLGSFRDGSPALDRLRRSSEYGFAIHAGLLPAGSLNHIRSAMGIPDSAFPGNALSSRSIRL